MFQKPVKLHFTKTGRGQQSVPTVPWISSDFNAFASPETYGAQGPSQPWFDEFGNTFSLRQARAAGVIQAATVAWNEPMADTVAAAPTVTSIGLTTGSPYTAADAEVNNWLYVLQIGAGSVGSDKTQSLKRIKKNAAGAGGFFTVAFKDTLQSNGQNDPDAFKTVPVAGNDLSVIRPYEVRVTATTDLLVIPCVGVAVQAIADTKWGFIQTAGLALTLSKGNATALVAGSPCVLDDTIAGYVKGAAAQAAGQVGICAAPCATATTISPIWLTLWST